MNVMFICSSLELGKDGVGDYTRKLSTELVRLGNNVSIIALHDKHLESDVEIKRQEKLSQQIRILRMSNSLAWKAKIKLSKEFIKECNPEWISLQYVPYGFNKRGLPFMLIWLLFKIRNGVHWHIMFHEIWQGESIESSRKEKAIGLLQRTIAFRIISTLKICRISTSNKFYQKCFSKYHIDVNIIPVFSNIPQGLRTPKNALLEKIGLGEQELEEILIAAFFGGFQWKNEITEKLSELCRIIKHECGKSLVVTHIGRARNIEQVFKRINNITGIACIVIGEWPEQDVADYLSFVDFGLSTNPKILFEKSGSISALLYNKKPVVILQDGFEFDEREIKELKEVRELNDIVSFVNQDRSFGKKYSVEGASIEYIKIFSKNL